MILQNNQIEDIPVEQ